MTPMVKLRCARSERAKKFGRYLYFCTAAKILLLVSCGMVSATRDPLMTSEIVAGASPRTSASCFKLTGFRLETALLLFFSVTLRSLAQTHRASKGPRVTSSHTIDIGSKKEFDTARHHLLTRFSRESQTGPRRSRSHATGDGT